MHKTVFMIQEIYDRILNGEKIQLKYRKKHASIWKDREEGFYNLLIGSEKKSSWILESDLLNWISYLINFEKLKLVE